MGMAASQARYLALTARKSNVEFQGQQINQQRTRLAVEQTELFNELMELKTPVPPSEVDYMKSVYTFEKSSSSSSITFRILDSSIKEIGEDTTGKIYSMTVQYDKDGTSYSVEGVEGYLTQDPDTKLYTEVKFTDTKTLPADYVKKDDTAGITRGQWEDEKAYTDALNQYNYNQSLYAKRIEEINAKAEKIQIEDRTLELKLRNLDTEQNALQTELESVKKVIQDTIDTVFKTFQS